MNVREACRTFARKTGYPETDAINRARLLQHSKDKWLPLGTRGKPGRDLNPSDAAAFLIGLFGTQAATVTLDGQEQNIVEQAVVSRGRMKPLAAWTTSWPNEDTEVTRRVPLDKLGDLGEQTLLEILTHFIAALGDKDMAEKGGFRYVEFVQNQPVVEICIEGRGKDELECEHHLLFAPSPGVRLANTALDGAVTYSPRVRVPVDAMRVLADIAAGRERHEVFTPERVTVDTLIPSTAGMTMQ